MDFKNKQKGGGEVLFFLRTLPTPGSVFLNRSGYRRSDSRTGRRRWARRAEWLATRTSWSWKWIHGDRIRTRHPSMVTRKHMLELSAGLIDTRDASL